MAYMVDSVEEIMMEWKKNNYWQRFHLQREMQSNNLVIIYVSSIEFIEKIDVQISKAQILHNS